ncbi:MAG: PfkB family carbohydrate kinase [Candidatus Faecousia sp.]|nr:carbohydrate kinase family protein [Clostridiales bacterium]MDY6180520.1 PfkB family carbohydrate kinase [Candidatus Faecousia sp.]
MGIVVIGAVFVDIKGYPEAGFIPTGRNVGRVEQIHGGVGRNVAEDVANCELRPTFVSLVDESGTGADVVRKLESHKVDTRYIRATRDGMGTWLAVFDNEGDVAASISKRPNLMPIADILDQQGHEIFRDADSVIIEIDMDKEVVKRAFRLAKEYGKKIYGVVANMSIAQERRDFLQNVDCFVCNLQEAGILFSDDFTGKSPKEMIGIAADKVSAARIPSMIITMGAQGAVYADMHGTSGYCPARKVEVKDTTGAGDAFCAGAAIGLTYGKSLAEACEIGAHLAASVIVTSESVCPRFLPRELGLDMDVE